MPYDDPCDDPYEDPDIPLPPVSFCLYMVLQMNGNSMRVRPLRRAIGCDRLALIDAINDMIRRWCIVLTPRKGVVLEDGKSCSLEDITRVTLSRYGRKILRGVRSER